MPSATTLYPSVDWTTRDVNGAQHTTARLGTITMNGTECAVDVALRGADHRFVSRWDLFAHPGGLVLTWNTDRRDINPRAVLAAAPLSLASYRPGLIPEVPGDLAQWNEHATATGDICHDLPVLTIQDDTQMTTLYAYFNPELNSVVGCDPAAMSVALPDKATGGRMLLFPVASPEVSAVDLFERLRRAPMDLR